MKQGWEIKKLQDVCTVQYGYPFDSAYFTKDNSFMPLIRIRDVKRSYTETFYKGDYSPEYIINSGDSILGMDGEFHISEWKGVPSLLNQRVCKITSSSKNLLNRFVLKYLPIPLKQIEDLTPFVTVKHLSARKIASIPIPIPPVAEQERIVEELDLLSGVVEKKKAQLQELDNLAQSIFFHTFGDPIANDKGWETCRLREIAPTTPYQGEIKPKNNKYWLLNLDMVQSNTGEIINKVYVNPNDLGNSTTTFSSEHVLYSKLRPYLNKVVLPRECGYSTSELLPLLPNKTKLAREYLAYMLRCHAFVKYISIKVAGAKMPRVRTTDLYSFHVPVPPLSLQQEFASKVAAIEEQKGRVKASLREAETLLQSRMAHYFD